MRCFRTTRWASFLISLVLCMCWFFGVGAYHSGREDFYGGFTVASILLGVCVFILRISTDEEVRSKSRITGDGIEWSHPLTNNGFFLLINYLKKNLLHSLKITLIVVNEQRIACLVKIHNNR